MARHDYPATALVATVIAWAAGAAWAAEAPLPSSPEPPAAPSVRIEPDRVRPGDAFLVTVLGAAAAPTASVADRPLRFFPVAGGFQAVAALPVEFEPGRLGVEVTVPGLAAPLRAEAEVLEPDFPEARLRVAPRFVSPSPRQRKQMERDQEAFRKAFDQPFEPPLFGEAFSPPREAEVRSAFGERRVFNGKKQSQHYGTDLAGQVGDPVAASNDGLVVLARDCYASGKSLVLWHGAGLFTVYFHLSSFEARPGDRVRRGQVVGRVGQSGRVTGPHLHFGTKLFDLYVAPESVYRLRFSAPVPP